MPKPTVIRFPLSSEVWRDGPGAWAWVVRDNTGSAIGMDTGLPGKARAKRDRSTFQDALMRASSMEDEERHFKVTEADGSVSLIRVRGGIEA